MQFRKSVDFTVNRICERRRSAPGNVGREFDPAGIVGEGNL